MKVQAPCMGCEDRNPECHGKCEKYAAYRAEREKEYAHRAEAATLGADSDWKRRNERRKLLQGKR